MRKSVYLWAFGIVFGLCVVRDVIVTDQIQPEAVAAVTESASSREPELPERPQNIVLRSGKLSYNTNFRYAFLPAIVCALPSDLETAASLDSVSEAHLMNKMGCFSVPQWTEGIYLDSISNTYVKLLLRRGGERVVAWAKYYAFTDMRDMAVYEECNRESPDGYTACKRRVEARYQMVR